MVQTRTYIPENPSQRHRSQSLHRCHSSAARASEAMTELDTALLEASPFGLLNDLVELSGDDFMLRGLNTTDGARWRDMTGLTNPSSSEESKFPGRSPTIAAVRCLINNGKRKPVVIVPNLYIDLLNSKQQRIKHKY